MDHSKVRFINLFTLRLFTDSDSGAWLILPSYMCYVFGSEMLQGLAIASGDVTQADDNTRTLKAQ